MFPGADALRHGTPPASNTGQRCYTGVAQRQNHLRAWNDSDQPGRGAERGKPAAARLTSFRNADRHRPESTHDNHITAYANAENASQDDAAGLVQLDSQATLAKVSTDWPLSRFVEIWNGIPGQTPVHKFQDRKKAVARVWAALQPLAGNGPPTASEAEKPEPGPAGKPDSKAKPVQTVSGKAAGHKAPDRSPKKAEVIARMARAKGATLAEIMQATGWQKHTVRGFVSILGSPGGHTIESSQNAAGERTCQLAK